MSNTPIGQFSWFAPGFVEFQSQMHMVFVSRNQHNALLHVVSTDGGNTWTRLKDLTGQSSSAEPALASYSGKLVVAYVANNESGNILITVYNPADDSWSNDEYTNESTSGGVTLTVVNGDLFMAYPSDNSTQELLISDISSLVKA